MKDINVIKPAVEFSRIRKSLLAPLLALATAISAGQVDAQTGSKFTEQEKADFMKVHNDARREVGNQPLQWDNKVAREAQLYAEYLASTGLFKHAKHVPGWKRPLGENLAMNYDKNPAKRGAEQWYAEKADFVAYGTNGQVLPSHFGSPVQVGHYTAMVWQDSTKVGAGMARYTAGKNANGGWVVVGKYSVRGNIMKRYAYGKPNTGSSFDKMKSDDLGWLETLNNGAPTEMAPSSSIAAQPLFTVKDFSATCNGGKVNVSFTYESNLTFADNAHNENQSWQITPFTSDGKQDALNGFFSGGFSSGVHTEPRTFGGYPALPGSEMKPGAYFELQLLTRHRDGTATVSKVLKKGTVTGAVPCVDIKDVDKHDPSTEPIKDSTDPTTDATDPLSETTKSSGAGSEPFEVLLLMGNTAQESYRITLERAGNKIGEYHLTGTDELWDGKHPRALSHPAFYAQEFRSWKTVSLSMTLRKFGKTKPGVNTRIRTGVRFGDTLRIKQVGSSDPEKTWVVKALNATGSQTIKLKSGSDLTVREMSFNPKTEFPRPQQPRRRRVPRRS